MRVAALRDKGWVGVDIGKTHHWVCVVDAEGAVLLSVKIGNDEVEILSLIATVSERAEQLVWAVDIVGSPSALILALLTQAGQSVRYASGRVVAAMSAAYVGGGKTDAKDAYVIAETATATATATNRKITYWSVATRLSTPNSWIAAVTSGARPGLKGQRRRTWGQDGEHRHQCAPGDS
jgi:hypothetical protein